MAQKFRKTISRSDQWVRKYLRSLGIDPNKAIYIPGSVLASRQSTRIMGKYAKESPWTFKGKKVVPFIMSGEGAKHYNTVTVPIMMAETKKWYHITAGMTAPIYVGFMLIRPRYEKWDFSDIVQSVLDAMQGAGWIEDTDARHILPYPFTVDGGRFPVRVDSPGVIIMPVKTNPFYSIRLAEFVEAESEIVLEEEPTGALRRYLDNIE